MKEVNEKPAIQQNENPKQVLCVDDDAASRALMVYSLNRLGYEPIEASSGKEALNLFEMKPIDVVISDWVMPEIDGLQLCQEMRKKKRHLYTYFILLTSLNSKNDHQIAMEKGVDDFLQKPLDMEELGYRLLVANRIHGFIQELTHLKHILRICMYSKKICDDESGEWLPVEEFINRKLGTKFTHGIAPDYLKKALQDLELEEDESNANRG